MDPLYICQQMKEGEPSSSKIMDDYLEDNRQKIKNLVILAEEHILQDDYSDDDNYHLAISTWVSHTLCDNYHEWDTLQDNENFAQFVLCVYVFLYQEQLKSMGLLNE